MQDFYTRFNTGIDYIEAHLDDEIDFTVLAHRTGINFPLLQRIFPLFAGISLAEYIRNRRLTLAGRDLVQTDLRISDLACKYGYQSSASFSRAFVKFHGMMPSKARHSAVGLRHYPRLTLERPSLSPIVSYDIITLPSLTLYGFGINTDCQHIKRDAPAIYSDLEHNYPALSHPDYGMIIYRAGRDSADHYEYWVLWKTLPTIGTTVKPYHISQSRWLRFTTNSQNASAIQATCDHFYQNFLPTCPFQLKPQPELEYYHDGITELLIPIA